MGVQLPASTRFVIANESWFYAVLFIGAAALILAKEFLIRDKRLSLGVTLMLSLLMIFAADWIRGTFLQPLLDLAEKLSR